MVDDCKHSLSNAPILRAASFTIGYRMMLSDLIPSTVQSLVLFENSNEQYLAIMSTTTSRSQSLDLQNVLAMLSIQLRTLSASLMADAGQFFDSCCSSLTWQNLTSLTLTSNLLSPSTDANAVLQQGAEVALRMPNLGIMEIWNGGTELEAPFQYRPEPDPITWKGTWDFRLLASTIHAWKAVAERRGTGLGVVHEIIDENSVACLGDAIYYLGHLERVLRPVSLQQIRLEGASKVAHNQNDH